MLRKCIDTIKQIRFVKLHRKAQIPHFMCKYAVKALQILTFHVSGLQLMELLRNEHPTEAQ